MRYTAKFKAGKIEEDVLSCTYSFYQAVDASGRPLSPSRGGQINIEILGSNRTDLFEWMCENLEHKDGQIVFLQNDSEAALKELTFKEAYLINFTECFSTSNANSLSVIFTISAKEIIMEKSVYSNKWN